MNVLVTILCDFLGEGESSDTFNVRDMLQLAFSVQGSKWRKGHCDAQIDDVRVGIS